MSSKKIDPQSSAMKRTSEWIFSQEIPSDVIVHVGGASFELHKFPLVSKSRYIKKIVSASSNADLPKIELPDIPGGAEAFELAAKFCYGINFEIHTENIAMLRCTAEYLEMTEDQAVGNMIARTEAYLNEVSLKSLAGAVTVLHKSESLLPIADRVKLVSRCIDAIAFRTCEESQFNISGRAESVRDGFIPSAGNNAKPVVDWWAEDLIVLSIDTFRRVLVAMMARGFKKYALGPVLMLYAQKSLRGLDMLGKGRKKIEPEQEHEKRAVLETIASLLPWEKNAISVSFLSMLLRAAIYLETTVACRLDLEKRMALQLGQAVLGDLLIPSYSFTGDTQFEVDTVKRVLMNYFDCSSSGNHLASSVDEERDSLVLNDIKRVGKLMENYLAEIATDRNLSVSKFVSLAEVIPEDAKVTEDGMYRAIDIYLKAHSALSDIERKKICSVMDCQKLSREACAHAAQNDRVPVKTVVQLLYYEQQRLQNVMNDSLKVNEDTTLHSKSHLFARDVHPVSDELLKLQRENRDLKLELVKIKTRLKEIDKSMASSVTSSPMGLRSTDITRIPRKSFMNSVSKKLGRLSPFGKLDGVSNSSGRLNPPKDRRYSIS